MAEKTKKATLKSVNADIEKINTQLEKKKSSLSAIQKEIKDLELQLKDCFEMKDQLIRDSVQQQIITLFKDKSIHPEQLGKIVGVMTQLKDEINNLNENDIVDAVKMVVDDKKNINTEKTVVNTNDRKISE